MDELQRRLRDADPLTASAGSIPDAMRLDAIKEQIMLTDERPIRAAFRPRRLGLVGLGAASLLAVMVAGNLARPTAQTLAWDPEPTIVSNAQKAAAYDTCTKGVTSLAGDGAASDGGRGATGGLEAPIDLPPLVSLELHGNGGIAILVREDPVTPEKDVVAYCLLRSEGDGFTYGGLVLGAESAAPVGTLALGAMSTDFEGTNVGMIWGSAPDGVTSVRLVGGPGDGGIATVQDGRFAIWLPGSIMDSQMELVGLDESGTEVLRQKLEAMAGERPIEGQATPDPNGSPVKGEFSPAP